VWSVRVEWCCVVVDVRVSRLAELVVKYCIGLKSGEEVYITGTVDALPLIRELYRFIVSNGGYPLLYLYDESLLEVFYKYARENVLKHVSNVEKYTYEHVNARISVLSYTHTKYLSSISPERVKLRNSALRVLTEIFMRRDAEGTLKWVVVPYPTKAMAQEAGMSLFEFEDFVYKACMVDRDNPVEAWIEQGKRQEKIVQILSRAREIRIVAEDTDLYLRVDGRKWINDDGHNNMPGGEVFTAPIEDSVEGTIRFTYPAIWRGIEVEDVKLVFRRGRVVEAKAAKGEEFLKKILETDEGACRVGEFAFGLNYNITKFTKQILFDEKIGGTIHLALGASYPKTGGKNKSAIHWDMIKDMSKGRIYIDGELLYENGKFKV